MFFGLIQKAIEVKPDIKCLILFDTVILLEQQYNSAVKIFGQQNVGIYCGSKGEHDGSRPITIGSIQSIKKDSLNFNLIIVDETHLICERGGHYIKYLKEQIEANPKTKVVGVTATPFRSDGYIYGPKKFYKRPCFERKLDYFIDKGFLVTPIAKKPDHQFDVSNLRIVKGDYDIKEIEELSINEVFARKQVIDAVQRLVDRKKVVWFCTSIAHAELIKTILLSLGEKAESIHSNLSEENRAYAKEYFEKGDGRHLTFVSVISKGYDYPPIDAIVLMRPTRSPVMYLQVCGRGLRPSPGKEDLLILDYGQVVSLLGPLNDPIITKATKGQEKNKKVQKECPECRTYNAIAAMTCFHCEYVFYKPREDATKLDLSANQEVSLLKTKENKIPVSRISIEKYLSKNNNECIRIRYFEGSAWGNTIDEYFIPTNEFGWKSFMKRAIDLGLEINSDISKQVLEIPKKKPKFVWFKMDGQHRKVTRLEF
jgi:DNA repair protein RadD